MPNFTIEQLSEDRIFDAWPVVRASGAEPVREWWESEAKSLIDRGGGVLVARAGNGCILGLALYEAIQTLSAGRVLEVDKLITFELSRKEPVKQALSDALKLIASRSGCSRVALPVVAKSHAGYLPVRNSSARRDDLDVCA